MAETQYRHKDLKANQINGKCLEWVDGPEGQCYLEINVMSETKTWKATETLEKLNAQATEADSCTEALILNWQLHNISAVISVWSDKSLFLKSQSAKYENWTAWYIKADKLCIIFPVMRVLIGDISHTHSSFCYKKDTMSAGWELKIWMKKHLDVSLLNS